MTKNKKYKVVIVGGGYAGVSLLDKLKNNKLIELVLIDKSQVHLLQTHIHKYLSGYYDKKDITFNHAKYCLQNNIEFVCDEVISINYNNNYIITRNNHIEYYDYLVMATGAVSIFPKQIDNILEYTKDIKNIDNLDYYKDKFLKMLNSSPKNQNIVVVGGGVSGFQIACEYAYHIQNKGFDKSNIKVTLVEGMPTILPGMDEFLVNKAKKRCDELGIEVINNKFASKILEDKIVLSDKNEVSYDLLIFVIGARGNTILNIDSNDIEINPRNQLIVDEYYRLKPYKNVFAIGDIAEAIDIKTKNYQAPTAQASRLQAELTAKNILNDIEKVNFISNNVSLKGILIDLGGPSCAIGKLFGINLSGKIAVFFKRLIYSLHSKKFG